MLRCASGEQDGEAGAEREAMGPSSRASQLENPPGHYVRASEALRRFGSELKLRSERESLRTAGRSTGCVHRQAIGRSVATAA